MVIDLRELKRRGENASSFEYECEVPEGAITLPNASVGGKVEVFGEITVDEDDVFVSGKISFLIKGECSRCLKPTDCSVVLEFDEKFEPSAKCDKENYSYSNMRLDLTDMVNDLILTGIPYAVFCKDDCKGLCPNCGADLNEGDCDCAK